MSDRKDVIGCMEIVIGVGISFMVCLILSLCCSCKAQKEVQIERVEVPVVVTQEHTIESVKIDHIRDTLIQRDSVYHYIKGDTTIIERWHYTQGNTIIAKADTLYIYDSIPYPVETITTKEVTKIEKVEKPLKWYQKALMWAGGISLLFGAFIIVWAARKR